MGRIALLDKVPKNYFILKINKILAEYFFFRSWSIGRQQTSILPFLADNALTPSSSDRSFLSCPFSSSFHILITPIGLWITTPDQLGSYTLLFCFISVFSVSKRIVIFVYFMQLVFKTKPTELNDFLLAWNKRPIRKRQEAIFLFSFSFSQN